MFQQFHLNWQFFSYVDTKEMKSCVSGIWTKITWLWWIDFRFERISGNNQATPTIVVHIKSGQKLPKSNCLATFTKVQSESLKNTVWHEWNATECVTYLDWQSEMIIFELILTTFEASFIFRGSLGSIENWLEPKTKPTFASSACPNLWNALYNT